MDVTEVLQNVNWLAVIVATAAMFVLGWIWYSFLFKNAWAKESGVSEEPQGGVTKMFIAGFVLTFIGMLVLALFILSYEFHDWLMGLKLGVLVSVGFIGTSLVNGYMYQGKSAKLMAIDAFYSIIGYAIGGIIIAVW